MVYLRQQESLPTDVPAVLIIGGKGYTESDLEQVRKSDREVIQKLVDDIRRLRMEFGNRVGCTTQIGNASLALAKSKCNIEPKTEQR